MNFSLIQAILAAGNSDGDSAFWTQMLVFVILAAAWGVYVLVKRKPDRSADDQENYVKGKAAGTAGRRLEARLNTSEAILTSESKTGLLHKKDRDVSAGMESLELDFLLSVVENTENDDEHDVIMRKLNFSELVRRCKLDRVDSNALKVYATDQFNLYGKHNQYEALKELTARTLRNSDHSG